jgi:RING-type zinc-finger
LHDWEYVWAENNHRLFHRLPGSHTKMDKASAFHPRPPPGSLDEEGDGAHRNTTTNGNNDDLEQSEHSPAVQFRREREALRVPASAKCPVCLEVVQDPHSLDECGHSFCRDCLYALAASRAADSTTAATETASTDDVSVSLPASSPAESWSQSSNVSGHVTRVLVQCPVCRGEADVGRAHRNRALRELISSLPQRCRFRPDGCPEIVPFGGMRQHEALCAFAPRPCAHVEYGCTFVGTAADVRAHAAGECVFERLRGYFEAQDARVRALEGRVDALERENAALLRAGSGSGTPLAGMSTTPLDRSSEIPHVASRSSSSSSSSSATHAGRSSTTTTATGRASSEPLHSVGSSVPTATAATDVRGHDGEAATGTAGGDQVQSEPIRPAETQPATVDEMRRENWHVESLDCELMLPGHARGVTAVLFLEKVCASPFFCLYVCVILLLLLLLLLVVVVAVAVSSWFLHTHHPGNPHSYTHSQHGHERTECDPIFFRRRICSSAARLTTASDYGTSALSSSRAGTCLSAGLCCRRSCTRGTWP